MASLIRPGSAAGAWDSVAVAKVDDEGVEVGWNLGLDANIFLGERMFKSESLGVKRLAMEGGLAAGAVAGTVDRVSDDGVPDIGEMDADLVGPAGFEPACDERGHRSETFDDAIMGDGVLALAGHASDASAEVAAIGDQGSVHGAGGGGDAALDNGDILALDVVGLEKFLKSADGFGSTGQGEGARGVHIEPVDDADERTGEAVADGEVLARAFDQGIALAVGRGQGEEPGGLVDDHDVPVFMQNPEPGGDKTCLGAVREEGHGSVGLDFAAWFIATIAADIDPTISNGILRGATGEAEPLGDQFIKTYRHGLWGWEKRGADSEPRNLWMPKAHHTFIQRKDAREGIGLAAAREVDLTFGHSTQSDCTRRVKRQEADPCPLTTVGAHRPGHCHQYLANAARLDPLINHRCS